MTTNKTDTEKATPSRPAQGTDTPERRLNALGYKRGKVYADGTKSPLLLFGLAIEYGLQLVETSRPSALPERVIFNDGNIHFRDPATEAWHSENAYRFLAGHEFAGSPFHAASCIGSELDKMGLEAFELKL